MKILTVPSFLFFAMAGGAYATPTDKHPVSPLAWELQVERVGDVLFRYIRFMSESEYPCLRLETFDPDKNLKRLHRREVCQVRAGDETIDVRNDVSGVMFEGFKLDGRDFYFAADIVLRQPGSRYLNCKVTITDKGKISEPNCKEGQRPPDR